MKKQKFFCNLVISVFLVLFFLRGMEMISLWLKYGGAKYLLKEEFLGFVYDFLSANLILCLLYLPYKYMSVKWAPVVNFVFLSFLFLYALLHLFIIQYFVYQLQCLDVFLFQYSWEEILYTIRTSSESILNLLLGIFFLFILFIGIFKWVLRWNLPYKIFGLLVLLVVIYIGVRSFHWIEINKYSKNKSLYLYTNIASFLLHSPTTNIDYSLVKHQEYKRLFEQEDLINSQYPLLHKFQSEDVLKPYFNVFDTAPNIVIIIIEGLNDDYLNSDKENIWMPFLSSLKNESLYWNHCLTLGERSFAVVPSILGGLPYGKIGFTFIDDYPVHHTLVSILNENQYITSFFYGQGAWFHRKDVFLKYNNIRHIYDYTTYSAKYPKIIVGKDHYFWGYNDQSLFEHALEVTMPIQNEKRLDIFFTGSMHSPFSIAPKEKLYDKKVEKIKGVAGTQKKFVESILFTDDALREFFTNYRKRRDYNHTLFIITGDHPMTELPIKNALKRYHVPLILYSPQLIKPWVFTNVVSHLDIYETLLAFLKPYGVHVPVLSASLGRKLKTDKPAPYTLVFMNSNRVLKDVFTNGYFLSEKNLYKVDSNFNCIPTEDSLLTKKLQAKLKAFEEMNYYVSFKNRIYPNLYGK